MATKKPSNKAVTEGATDAVRALDLLAQKEAESKKAIEETITALSSQLDAIERLKRSAKEHTAITEELTSAQQSQVEVSQEAAEATKELDEQSASLKSMQEAIVKAVKDSNKVMRYSFKSLVEMTKEYAKNSKAIQTLTVGVKTFTATLRAIKAVTGGVIGVLGSLASMLFEVGAAILSAPFKLMEVLIGRAKEAMGSGTELAEAYENVREVFGDISKGTSKDIINIGRSLATGVIAPGLTARQVFGTLAEGINEINKVASATPALFQSLSGQFNESGLQIMAMAKGLGFGEEELVGLQQRAIATGESLVSMEAEVAKYAKGMSAQFGLNSKVMSRDMGRAMKDVKHFANATVKEIAQATTFAHKLGLELKDITGTLDAFNTFDQAAENVAKLSQAFGVNIDVMKLVEANTPDEQINEIKKAFTAAGKSADQMNRQELQLIASTTGMTEEAVRQALSMKNAGVSMDAVKSSAGALQSQTMDTGQAINALAADIKKMVKSGQAPEGASFFEIFLEGFVKGIDLSKDFQKMIQAVMKDIWIVQRAGMDVGRAFVKFFPGFSEFLKGVTEFLNPAKISSLMSTITGTFTQFFEKLGKGTATVEGLVDSLITNFSRFFSADEGGKQILSGLSKMWKAVERIISTGIDWITKNFKQGLVFIDDILSGKYRTRIESAGEQIQGGLAGAVSSLKDSPIFKSLVNMYEQLREPIGKVFEKLFDVLLEKLGKALSKYKWEIALVAFGPTLLNILVQAFLAPALKAAAEKLFAGAVNKFGDALSAKLKQQQQSLNGTQRTPTAAPSAASVVSSAPVPAVPSKAAIELQGRGLDPSRFKATLAVLDEMDGAAQKVEKSIAKIEPVTSKSLNPNKWSATIAELDRLDGVTKNVAKSAAEIAPAATKSTGVFSKLGSVGKSAMGGLASGFKSVGAAMGPMLAEMAVFMVAFEAVKLAFNEWEKLQSEKKRSDRQSTEVLLESKNYEEVVGSLTDSSVDLGVREKLALEEMKKLEEIIEEEDSGLDYLFDTKTDKALDAQARLEQIRNVHLKEIKDQQRNERASLIKGTKEYNERLAREEKELIAQQDKRILEQMGLGENFTIENAEQQVKKLQNLGKMFDGVDIKGILDKIKEKFSVIKDWSLVTPQDKDMFDASVTTMNKIGGAFVSIADAIKSAKVISETKFDQDAVSRVITGMINAANTATQVHTGESGATLQVIDLSKSETQFSQVKSVFERAKDAAATLDSLSAIGKRMGNWAVNGTPMRSVHDLMVALVEVPNDVAFLNAAPDLGKAKTQFADVDAIFGSASKATDSLSNISNKAASLGSLSKDGSPIARVKSLFIDFTLLTQDLTNLKVAGTIMDELKKLEDAFQKFIDVLKKIEGSAATLKKLGSGAVPGTVMNGFVGSVKDVNKALGVSDQPAAQIPSANASAPAGAQTGYVKGSTNWAEVMSGIPPAPPAKNAAVQDAITKLDAATSNLEIGKDGKVRVKLPSLGKGVGKATEDFKLQAGPFNINMQVNVELAVSDVEKTIMKSGKIIKGMFNELAGPTKEVAPSGTTFVPTSQPKGGD